jgi:Putative phage tail protein
MANVLIPAAVGIGLNFLLSLLTPVKKVRNEGPRLDNTGAPKSDYGFPLSEGYGRNRVDGCLMFWALPLQEVVTQQRTRQGGKGGGGVQTINITYSYFLTAAFAIGGEIGSVRRVRANGELIFDSNSNDEKSNIFRDKVTIYRGTQTQNPDPTISAIEGTIPAFRGTSYLVFDRYPCEIFKSNAHPKIDVEYVGKFGESPYLRDVLSDCCQKAGLLSSEIETEELISERVKGCALKNDGSIYRDFIEELQRIFFVIVQERGRKIHFIRQSRSGDPIVIDVSSLASREFTAETPDLFLKKLVHFREIPSEVQIEYPNINKNYDNGMQAVRNPTAIHDNPLNIRVSVVGDDSEMLTAANKILYQAETQSLQYEKIFLLPEYDYLKVGDVIAIGATAGTLELIQIAKKTNGINYLIELQCNRYAGYIEYCDPSATYEVTIDELIVFINILPFGSNTFVLEPLDTNFLIGTTYTIQGEFIGIEIIESAPGAFGLLLRYYQNCDPDDVVFISLYSANGSNIAGFGSVIQSQSSTVNRVSPGTGQLVPGGIGNFDYTVTSPNTYNPPATPTVAGTATVIPLDIPLISDSDNDLGLYIAVVGSPTWTDGALFGSSDSGQTWGRLETILDTSTVGTVANPLPDTSPHFIDTSTTFEVELQSGSIDPAPDSVFLAGGSLILVGDEIIAFRDAVLLGINPRRYRIEHLIRGVKGTEYYIDKHGEDEQAIVLTDYLLRIEGRLSDINRSLRFKAVGRGALETGVTDFAEITVAGNSLKPFLPVIDAVKVEDDWLISWSRRTRKNGRLSDYVDIPFADGEIDRFTIQFLNGSGSVVSVAVATGREYLYTAAGQVLDFGSIQSTLRIKVFQDSSFPVGRSPSNIYVFI